MNQHVRISLCTDLKLKHQLKKQKFDRIKELGDFLYEFGFDPLINPSKRNKV